MRRSTLSVAYDLAVFPALAAALEDDPHGNPYTLPAALEVATRRILPCVRGLPSSARDRLAQSLDQLSELPGALHTLREKIFTHPIRGVRRHYTA